MIEYKKRIEEARAKSREEWHKSRMERYGQFKLNVLEDLEQHLTSFCEKNFHAKRMPLNAILSPDDSDFVELFNEEKLIDLHLTYCKIDGLYVNF